MPWDVLLDELLVIVDEDRVEVNADVDADVLAAADALLPLVLGTAVHLLPLMLVMNCPDGRAALVDIVGRRTREITEDAVFWGSYPDDPDGRKGEDPK